MRIRVAVLALSLLAVATITSAQIKLPKKLPRLPGLDRIPGLDRFLGKEAPITTGLEDALTEVEFLDGFEPSFPMSLGHAERDNDGIFTLRPGAYRYESQSYCLKAGTHGPGRGEGYLYAPLEGPKAPIVRSVLRRSVARPEIEQRDVQVLLWAIIARTKLSDMSPEMQRTAAALLTPKEIFDLNGGALGLIPESVKQKALAELPESARAVLEAENRIRQMLTQVNSTFADLERVAVLVGEPPVEPGDRTDLPRQRWSYHPDGYFIRFDPHGYSQTTVDVYVPEPFTISHDVLGRITRISDRDGNGIETTYEPVRRTATTSPLRAASFASVRLTKAGRAAGKWDKTGWALVGVPGDGVAVAGENLKMTGVPERVAQAKRRKSEFERLLQALSESKQRRRNKSAPETNESLDELLALAHYYDAVKPIVGAKGKEQLEIVLRAWQATLRDAVRENAPQVSSLYPAAFADEGGVYGGSTGTNFDPSGSVGTPGQTGRQRIGQSSRCTNPCGCDRKSFCGDLAGAARTAGQMSASGASAQLKNTLTQQLNKLKEDFCGNPAAQGAVQNMLQDVASLQGGASDQAKLASLNAEINQMKSQMCSGPGGPVGGDPNCRESPLKAQMDLNRDQRDFYANQLRDAWNKVLELQDVLDSNKEAWNAFTTACGIAEIFNELIDAAMDALTPDELGDALDLIESIANGDLIGISGIEDLQDAQSIFEKINPGGARSWADAMRNRLDNCPNLNQALTDAARKFVDAYAQMPKAMGDTQELISRIKHLDDAYWNLWNRYYQDCLETARCKGQPESVCQPPPPAP